jgi:hypothetical protein
MGKGSPLENSIKLYRFKSCWLRIHFYNFQ